MRLTTRCIRTFPLALASLLAIGAHAQALDGTPIRTATRS